MNQEETIDFLNENHENLKLVIEALTLEEILESHILQSWNVKDIIAHLSAWNIEITKAIDKVLNDEDIWFRKTEEVDMFNKIQVTKRKPNSYEEIITEWESTFNIMIEKIKNLSEKEWNASSSYRYLNGDPITVASLFSFRYRNKGHEGRHADQIEEYFESEACDCRIY